MPGRQYTDAPRGRRRPKSFLRDLRAARIAQPGTPLWSPARCQMTPPDTNSTPSGGRPRSGCGPPCRSRPSASGWSRCSRSGRDGDTLYLTAPEGIRAWAERRYSSLIARSPRRLRDAAARGQLRRRRQAPADAAVAARRRRAEPQLHLRPLRHRRAATASPTPPRWPSPRRRRRPTTRSSCTARPGSARPTSWPRSPTTCATNAPGLSVRYTTAESLHQRVRRAPCAPPAPRRFKARYRDIDVLLIDDVQFLEGKPAHRRGVLPHLQRPL